MTKRKKIGIALLVVGMLFIAGLFFAVKNIPYLITLFWKVAYTADDCGGSFISPKVLDGLNKIRETTQRRFRVTSGYRSRDKNKKVGGVSKSMHIKGLALDMTVPKPYRSVFYAAAVKAGFTAFGWGNTTVHIDMGTKRWWTYDEKGRNMNGRDRYRYLHNAPENFKLDFGIR